MRFKPAAIGSHYMSIAMKASITNAVQELQKLNSALAAKRGRIAKVRCAYCATVLVCLKSHDRRQFMNDIAMIKEIAYHLEQLTASRELAQQLPHPIAMELLLLAGLIR